MTFMGVKAWLLSGRLSAEELERILEPVTKEGHRPIALEVKEDGSYEVTYINKNHIKK